MSMSGSGRHRMVLLLGVALACGCEPRAAGPPEGSFAEAKAESVLVQFSSALAKADVAFRIGAAASRRSRNLIIIILGLKLVFITGDTLGQEVYSLFTDSCQPF